MRKLLLPIYLFLPTFLLCQTGIKDISKRSHQVFAYKINASFVEKSIIEDSINVDAFIKEIPFKVFPADSIDQDKLEKGHYALIGVEDNRIVAKLIGISDLFAYPVNNQNYVQLLVVNKSGEFVNDAEVWVNGKSAPYTPDAQSYRIKQKNPDDALIKIVTPTDTLFTSLWIAEDLEHSVSEQKWNNFKRSGFVKIVSWIPNKIGSLFKKKNYSNQVGAKGLIVFNQPKYKRTDTVKLKAYIFDKNYKVYKEPVNVYMDYYANGKQHSIFLKTISQSTPGSYVYQFPLSDTLISDINYIVSLRTKDNRRVISKNFKIEEYLLDDITSYNIRSEKENYYKGDSLHFIISALDANGLPLLDTRVKLTITVSSIERFYKDTMYIPDTLFVSQKAMSTNGDTHFAFSSNQMPNADLVIEAKAQFNNGNDELKEKNIEVKYRVGDKEFKVFLEADSVIAEFRVNGKVETASGTVKIDNSWYILKNINYPFKSKVDPLADTYTFYLENENKIIDSGRVNIGERYQIELSRISQGDTLGFILENYLAIPVSFTVFDGNRIIGQGKSSERKITWTKADINKNRLYRVSWQFYWGGEERIQEENIALLYKLLKIDIKTNASVFPGQKDMIEIDVKDYLNRPASNVNLTALSYNNQLNKDIRVPEPPYLVNYKKRSNILQNKFEQIDEYIVKNYQLGIHNSWIPVFGLDTMTYFKMLFPDSINRDFVTPISDIIPEVSVHVSRNGEKEEIYMLYVNRDLVYYNGVTEKMKDAFIAYPGYVQFGIRLFDQFLQIDSVYIQPHYKHDLFFDLNKLPTASRITKLKPYYTPDERAVLEKSLFTNNFESAWFYNHDTNNYLWQYESAVKMSRQKIQILGPFKPNDSLHFYSENNFDIKFQFDPGYQYEIYPNMVRLERKPIFPIERKEIALPKVKYPKWIIGDTIPSLPEIIYSKQKPNDIYLPVSGDEYFSKINEAGGRLRYLVNEDTIINYAILAKIDSTKLKIVSRGEFRSINRIPPGMYTLLLVNKMSRIAEIKDLLILKGETLCVNAKGIIFKDHNPMFSQFILEDDSSTNAKRNIDTIHPREDLYAYQAGESRIRGKVLDKNGGLGIPGVTVLIKNTKTGTITSADGSFIINHIKPGQIIMVVAGVGYVSKEITVHVPEGELEGLVFNLEVTNASLQEVVVTGYGTQRKKNLTGSIANFKVNELSSMLQGKVSGIQIQDEGQPGSTHTIVMRGITSISGDSQPVYIIDGIFYDKIPGNISKEMIESIDVLNGPEASAIYGARGAGGVINIITKNKAVRNHFRDYAFWEPELFTDESGQVTFGVQYPDNITGWQIFVLGMDKKRRMGKSVSFVKSYKPLVGQLSLPQFMIIGDSAEVIGKALNYTKDEYTLQSKFNVNSKVSREATLVLKPSQSLIQNYPVIATSNDSLEVGFDIKTTTGFKDGEERKIPILKKGTLESTGQFWILNKDTTVSFNPTGKTERLDLFAQNNTLDVLLEEIEYLNRYPYYCMEQVSSKLKGLLIEKTIKEKLKQPFKHEKAIQSLVAKLQKGQQYDGSWGWWENEKGNIHITNYVIQAILPLRTVGMIETNIRNGLLFLQNHMNMMDRSELLSTLLTMSESKHLINYNDQLQKIPFDSLNIHQQWEYVKIMQNQKIEHTRELRIILQKGITGILGSLHWGEENYRWYSDEDASTVLAFQVLRNEKRRDQEVNQIFQYFLEKRKHGYWGNTVSSASIVSAVLPFVLDNHKEFNQPALLSVKGDTSFLIKEYPFHWTTSNIINSLNISKTGGGNTYLTLYQTSWNEEPKVDSALFVVSSYFENNGNKVSSLTSGERIKMVIDVNALKEAEYVMIEVPIPAGCVYGKKDQDSWGMHKEYLKNKVVLFAEKLNKGRHQFVVNLESRYNGKFTVNPSKVSLMYFPTFYGRNEMSKISITEK